MAKRLVLLEPYGPLEVQQYQPVAPSSHQIQVKNEATSLNHLDWKRIAKNLFINSFPHVLGMDVAGSVIDAASSTRFIVGDRVIAPGVVGYSDGCSFQTHVLVDEDCCARINKGISFSAASTLPFCLSTAACGLYLGLGARMELDDRSANSEKIPILIWGANGSVGKLAIQLAKISGYVVVAVTSSQKNAAEAKSRGADAVFSNDDPEIVPKIKSVAPELHYAFDTVVKDETISKIAQCISPDGIIATAIKYLGTSSKNIRLNSVFSGEIFGKTMTGQDSPSGTELGKWLWTNISQWLESGQLRPLDFEDIGGLADIEAGLNKMKDGKTKGKLVARTL